MNIKPNDCLLLNANCMDVFHSILQEQKNIIVVSDPPFNIGYHYNKYSDSMKDEEYYKMLTTLFGQVPSVVIHYPEALHRLSVEMGKCPERVVSWVYNSNTARQHRDIAFYDVNPTSMRFASHTRTSTTSAFKSALQKAKQELSCMTGGISTK